MTDPERIAELFGEAIQRARTDNRLEMMWNPKLADPNIYLSDEELDEFLMTFAENSKGEKIRFWVEIGSPCEERPDEEEPEKRCSKAIVGSVDWYDVIHSDSILVCREHIRPVYASLMTHDIPSQGGIPVLTINGKGVPRVPSQEM